jgi:hypothetical protein
MCEPPRYAIVILPLPYSGLRFVTPKGMTVRKATGVAAVLLVPLLLVACGHAAVKPLAPAVTLGYCGSNPQVRPDVVLVVCSTDDITAENLVWSDWGAPSAHAKGSATVDLCAYSDCAAGDYISVAIDVTATRIVHCTKTRLAYSTLRYVFPGGSPFKSVPLVADSPAFFGGQNQPVPPRDQMVSLTC